MRVSSGEFYEKVTEAKLEISEILERARIKDKPRIGELLSGVKLPEEADESL